MSLQPQDPSRETLECWVDALILAVRDEGPEPRFHREVMQRHKKEWPTLWNAIDGIIRNRTNTHAGREGR